MLWNNVRGGVYVGGVFNRYKRKIFARKNKVLVDTSFYFQTNMILELFVLLSTMTFMRYSNLIG